MPCSSTIARSALGIWLLLPLLATAQDQQGSGSPYSAYGFGEFAGATQISQAMMGGLGVAVVDPVSTVASNPASYASLQRTAFETGLSIRSSTFTSNGSQHNGRRTDLMGLSLGVPFGKGRWGLGLGVNPVTNVGYRISDVQPLPAGAGEGSVTHNYTGDGGLNRAFFGFGWVLAHKHDSLTNGYRLSVGANVNYLFGTIAETRKAVYPTFSGFYNTSVVSSLVLRDPTGNLGVQFQGDLKPRKKLADGSLSEGLRYLAGVTAELPTKLGARRTDLVTTYGIGNSGTEIPFDTVYFADGRKGTVGLPVGLGLGFTVFDQHWSVSAELRQRDWRQLQVQVDGYALPNTLASSSMFILGASYRPSGDLVGGTFWKRSIYRAGVRYNSDYLVVDGHQLTEMGASVGISIPVMGSTTRSRLNFGFELGDRGTTDDGLIRERYAAFYVGVTITPDGRERWFRKSKIE